MTPEQFKEEMAKIIQDYSGDTEVRHEQMDELLCRTLTKLGYSEGIEIFELQVKWYA